MRAANEAVGRKIDAALQRLKLIARIEAAARKLVSLLGELRSGTLETMLDERGNLVPPLERGVLPTSLWLQATLAEEKRANGTEGAGRQAHNALFEAFKGILLLQRWAAAAVQDSSEITDSDLPAPGVGASVATACRATKKSTSAGPTFFIHLFHCSMTALPCCEARNRVPLFWSRTSRFRLKVVAARDRSMVDYGYNVPHGAIGRWCSRRSSSTLCSLLLQRLVALGYIYANTPGRPSVNWKGVR